MKRREKREEREERYLVGTRNYTVYIYRDIYIEREDIEENKREKREKREREDNRFLYIGTYRSYILIANIKETRIPRDISSLL